MQRDTLQQWALSGSANEPQSHICWQEQSANGMHQDLEQFSGFGILKCQLISVKINEDFMHVDLK